MTHICKCRLPARRGSYNRCASRCWAGVNVRRRPPTRLRGRPAARPDCTRPDRRPDLDKLVRSTLDALTTAGAIETTPAWSRSSPARTTPSGGTGAPSRLGRAQRRKINFRPNSTTMITAPSSAMTVPATCSPVRARTRPTTTSRSARELTTNSCLVNRDRNGLQSHFGRSDGTDQPRAGRLRPG